MEVFHFQARVPKESAEAERIGLHEELGRRHKIKYMFVGFFTNRLITAR